ncbi:hypothetical protein QYM36_014072 [Artemia franciscana]|uniref:Uncharacterized protein n=1 Tax=Artemia franciscana TaxID=6661 RepID=A0AA88HIU0_ARTSF|nr:hypothetical protein QYM36_014072 [Artemia franciscana]
MLLEPVSNKLDRHYQLLATKHPLYLLDQQKKMPKSAKNIRLYPKASALKNNSIGCKKGALKVFTDTPEKDAIEVASKAKQDKLKEKGTRKRQIWEGEKVSKKKQETGLPEDSASIKFENKNLFIIYVGLVLKMEKAELKIKFARKKLGSGLKFIFPDVGDIAPVNIRDVKLKLPCPTIIGGTCQIASAMMFRVLRNYHGLSIDKAPDIDGIFNTSL